MKRRGNSQVSMPRHRGLPEGLNGPLLNRWTIQYLL